MTKLYDVTAFSNDLEHTILAVCTGVDEIMTKVIEAEYARNFPGAEVVIIPSAGVQPAVEPKPLKIYSLLMAWNADNILDEGCYGTTVWAHSTEEAIDLARKEMVLYRYDSADHVSEDDGSGYDDLDITEGANIWAAPQMLEALKAAKDVLWSYDECALRLASNVIDVAIEAATPAYPDA